MEAQRLRTPVCHAAQQLANSERSICHYLCAIELARLLREALGGKSTAEQAAAIWQERARNLKVQVEHLRALSAHEEESVPRRWRYCRWDA